MNKIKICFPAFVVIFVFLSLNSVSATPFIDELNDLSNIGNDSGSCIFTLNQGCLEVTCTGGYGGAAIFGWNQGGPSAYNCNISLNPVDNQSIFVIEGISSITPEGQSDADLWIWPFFNKPDVGLYCVGGIDVPSGVNRFELDMNNLAQQYYPNNNFDFWSVQVGISTGGVSGKGFSFESISAIPEPGTMSLLALAGLAMLRRRKIS